MINQQPPPQNYRGYTPTSDGEFQYKITVPFWANPEAYPLHYSNDVRVKYLRDSNGNVVYDFPRDEKGEPLRDAAGELLPKQPIEIAIPNIANFEVFTQDYRLGNLRGGEVDFCREYAVFGFDCLDAEISTETAFIAFGRVVSLLELSQSRGGFFRRNLNTQRTEFTETLEPKRTGFLGMGKNKGDKQL